MKCPRCSAVFTGVSDENGFYNCPQCGARLRSKPTAVPSPKRSDNPGAHAADPAATLPPATPLKPIPRPGEPAASLELVLAEIRAVRRTQEDLLAVLRARPEPAAEMPSESYPEERPAAPSRTPVLRAQRRKTALLIDDDDQTRKVVLEALEVAQVPARAVRDGATGLEAIAAEKPDVIVLELDVGGEMAGKDAINMIKATMEWVDIPIILHTRLPIESQKEARTIHGADELVLKAPGSSEVLVQRVIQLFRRG